MYYLENQPISTFLYLCYFGYEFEFRKAHVGISQFRGKQNDTKGCEGPTPKSIQVLLLLIQHGANGLNLLEAQHVVLVEPLLNPAAEAQAISRVHRIGQKNKTLIHRFIVSTLISLPILHVPTQCNNYPFSFYCHKKINSAHELFL